jgi:hypothetical protein
MPDTIALVKYYEALTDTALLNLAREGGFTEEAQQVLAKELRRRNLNDNDVKRYVTRGEQIKLHEEAEERGSRGRGPGLLFFGRRFLNNSDKEANIQLRTKFFALGGIPLIPIASYRFKCTGHREQGRVIDRVPLNWAQVFITWGKTAILLIGAGLLIVGIEEGRRALGW